MTTVQGFNNYVLVEYISNDTSLPFVFQVGTDVIVDLASGS